MRRSRILTGLLAAALAAGVTMGSAAAYSDVDPERWGWAWREIDAMTERGIFKGYGDGTFLPAVGLPANQGLIVAARLRVNDPEERARIGQSRREEVAALVGEQLSWMWDEAAVCLETGIVSYDELAALCRTKRLTEPLATENFCVYIARAMGLEPMVEQLSQWPLNFTDADTISAACRPYVYALSVYSIVRGNEAGELNPKVTINRAQTAVILSRVMDWLEAQAGTGDAAEGTETDGETAPEAQTAEGTETSGGPEETAPGA